ncbi:MAG: low molecular weight protein-tyrosine-phosphatase [Alkalispirochaetaceae bacterium]
MKRLMFVCLGNICRSPLAQGVFVSLAREAGVAAQFEVESSGLGSWHTGEQVDRRMRATAASHGIDLDHRARQIAAEDLERYDLIIVMEPGQKQELQRLLRDPGAAKKIRVFREWDPVGGANAEVPDPYYGGDSGFERVYAIVERTCRALLDYLLAEEREVV